MSKQEQILQVYRGDTLLGVLSNIQLCDWPWYCCNFQPTLAFEEYKPLFDHASALGKDIDATEEWEMAYTKIEELELSLRYPDPTKTIHLLHFHIDGNTAEFKAIWD